MGMGFSISVLLRPLLLFAASFLIPVAEASLHSSGQQTSREREAASEAFGRRRHLQSFKETHGGTNITFNCAASGPCVACVYSEKNDQKYRCSETGYRIPLKCTNTKDGSKKTSIKKSQKGRSTLEEFHDKTIAHLVLHDAELARSGNRNLLDDSSTSESGSQDYVTYRSCIPPANEERLTIFGFEGIVLFLLIMSGSVVYFRRKQAALAPGVGAGRIQMNSRF